MKKLTTTKKFTIAVLTLFVSLPFIYGGCSSDGLGWKQPILEVTRVDLRVINLPTAECEEGPQDFYIDASKTSKTETIELSTLIAKAVEFQIQIYNELPVGSQHLDIRDEFNRSVLTVNGYNDPPFAALKDRVGGWAAGFTVPRLDGQPEVYRLPEGSYTAYIWITATDETTSTYKTVDFAFVSGVVITSPSFIKCGDKIIQ